jgi:RNA polymerase sigma-70 factor (ECF subfamily)
VPWSGSFNDPEWLGLERPLVERARRGDARAFGRLYEEFADVLFRQVLMPRLGDRAAAEEALGETFRAAFEQLPRFETREVSVYFWLVRIAQNKAADAQRELARRGKSSASFEALLGPLRAPSEDPEALAERRDELEQLRGRVADVLGRVNPRYRRAIELRLFEERSRAECAATLEVTVPTFDVLLLRALRSFRKEWEGG